MATSHPAFAVLAALLSFGCGWITCLAWRDDRPLGRRRLEEASASSGLDELLGISPTVARAIRTEIEQHGGARARSRWAEGAPELARHYKSKAYLQDAFVRLHGFLFAARLLPLVDWGKGRGIDMRAPASANIPTWLRNATTVGRGTGYSGYHAGPSVISRLAINSFVLAERDKVPTGSTCLGWDTTEYTDLVPGCVASKNWALVFKAGKPRADAAKRVLKADIAALGESTSSLAGLDLPRFDLIICQEVFEHVQRPVDGARALYNLLAPGGRVFFTTPFNAQCAYTASLDARRHGSQLTAMLTRVR